MRRTIASALALLSLLLLSTVEGTAQSGDIKLSVDPVQMVLPLDAQIQSAARIGDTTLVVWGSTKLVGSEVRNVLWMQMLVDTVPVGEKKIITSEEARPYGYVQVVAIGRMFLVEWNDRRSGTEGCYVISVTPDAEISREKREVPRWTHPYYLAEDGSLVSVYKDTVYIFRSYLDAQPERVTIAQAKNQLFIPSLDSLQRVQLSWVGSFYDYHSASTGTFHLLQADVGSVTEVSPGQWGTTTVSTVTIDSRSKEYDITGCNYWASTVERVAGNEYRVDYRFHYGYTDYQNSTQYVDLSRSFYFYHGMISGSPHQTSSRDSITVHTVTSKRLFSKTESKIVISSDSQAVMLSASAAVSTVNVPDRLPALQELEGRIVIGHLRYGLDSSATLGLWRSDNQIMILDTLAMNHDIQLSPDSSTVLMNSALYGEPDLIYLSATVLLKGKALPADTQSCALYIPSANGWKRVFVRSAENKGEMLAVLAGGVEPQSHGYAFALGDIENDGMYVRQTIVGTDRAGRETWHIDSAKALTRDRGFSILPIAPLRYLLLDQSSISLCERDSVLQYSTVTMPPSSPKFLQLPDRRILRWGLFHDAYILFTTYDTTGRFLGSVSYPHPADAADLFLTMTSDGSMLAMIAAGKSGVYAMIFDYGPQLRKTVRLLATSATHPTAAFLNDTLYVAWEDYRNGVSDIYGAIVTPEQMTVDVEEERSEHAEMTILPTPASDRVRLCFPTSVRAGATIDIVDGFGMMRMHNELSNGAREAEIDLSSLESGLYMAHVRDGGKVWAGRIMVVR